MLLVVDAGNTNTVMAAAEVSASEALGEIQMVDEAASAPDAVDQADDETYLNDPEIFDEEAVVFELFIPVVINAASGGGINQTESNQ